MLETQTKLDFAELFISENKIENYSDRMYLANTHISEYLKTWELRPLASLDKGLYKDGILTIHLHHNVQEVVVVFQSSAHPTEGKTLKHENKKLILGSLLMTFDTWLSDQEETFFNLLEEIWEIGMEIPLYQITKKERLN